MVDDGGGSDFSPPDDRVRVVHRDRTGGPAAARNTGIDAATGSVVVFLDDDDRFTPDRLDLAAQRARTRRCRAVLDALVRRPTGEADGGRRLDGDVSDHILDATTPHLGATAVRADRLLPLRRDLPGGGRRRMVVADGGPGHRRDRSPGRLRAAPPRGRTGQRHRRRLADPLQREAPRRPRRSTSATHPSARAFRLARMGVLAQSTGDRRQARSSFIRSLRARPNGLALRGLARSLRPAR